MSKKNFVFVFSCICLLGVLLFATYFYLNTPRDSSNADAEVSLGSGLEQQFVSVQGDPVTFEEYEGKVRVVTSWASWNPFSVTDLQVFNDIAGEYKKRNEEIAFIAINRKESKEQAQRFLSSLPELPHVQFAIDQNDTYYDAIGGYAMPETVLYSARGNIVEHVRGTLTHEELRGYIEAAKKAPK